MGFMKSLRDRVQAALNPRSEPRWESIRIHQPREQSEGMGRHPYSWSGIDREGAEKSGATVMRSQTVLPMSDGFYEAGYRQLTIYRDGAKVTGFDLREEQRQPS